MERVDRARQFFTPDRLPKPCRHSLQNNSLRCWFRKHSIVRASNQRLMQQLTWSAVSIVGFGSLAFGFTLFQPQDQVCNLSLLQPGISGACGSLVLGRRHGYANSVSSAKFKNQYFNRLQSVY
jgi:hypothetical protein